MEFYLSAWFFGFVWLAEVYPAFVFGLFLADVIHVLPVVGHLADDERNTVLPKRDGVYFFPELVSGKVHSGDGPDQPDCAGTIYSVFSDAF